MSRMTRPFQIGSYIVGPPGYGARRARVFPVPIRTKRWNDPAEPEDDYRGPYCTDTIGQFTSGPAATMVAAMAVVKFVTELKEALS